MKVKLGMESKTQSVKINAILNVIYTITNMIFPLITYPYVTRILLSDGMGKVSFFTSVSNYAVMIGSLGLGTYGIRAIAKVRDDKKELSKVTSELLIINTVITCIVVGLLAVSVFFVEKFASEPILFIINLIIILASAFGLNWFYSGLEQYAYITKRTIAFKAISLVLVFLLVKSKSDYPIYAAITAFSSVGAYFCNLIHSKRFFHFYISKEFNYKRHFKPMILLFGSILAVSVYTNLDTIMLGFINGDVEVGLYSVASKSKWILLSAVNAVSAVLLPRLSNYLSQNDTEKYNQTLRKSISFVFVITIPISIFFISEAADTIGILGGPDYTGAILGMQFLMPILIISGFSNVTGNQVLIPHGKDSQFLKAVSTGAIVDIILNAALMPSLGCTGAAIATLVAEFVQMSIQFVYSKADIIRNIHIRTIINAVVGSGIACAVTITIRSFIGFNVLISFIITGGVFFLVYGIVLIVLKEAYAMELLGFVGKMFKRGHRRMD